MHARARAQTHTYETHVPRAQSAMSSPRKHDEHAPAGPPPRGAHLDGARVLGDGEPKIGAHGKPVLFLHPKDFCGTLVELEQA